MFNSLRHANFSPTARSGTALRTRWAAVGAAVAVTIGATGIGGYNLVNADVGTGDRNVLVTIESCRLADTRAGEFNIGPRDIPLRADETHTFDALQSGVPCSGNIPASASGLLVNVTAVAATELTFLTIWPGGTRPVASSLNPAPGEPPTPNAVTIDLSDTDTFDVYNRFGQVEVLIDVVGYYEHHDHDDRYYTRTEADKRFDPSSSTCSAANFFPAASASGYEGSAGVRATPGDQSLFCGLDLPDGTVLESFTSYIYDGSAAANGQCSLGDHNLQTRETLLFATSNSTAGQVPIPQEIVTTLSPTFLPDGHQLYIECTSPDSLVAISGVTVDYRINR